jgi:hypothetical protein
VWDFQYRVAMDAYEQVNGKPKAPPVAYVPLDAGEAGSAPPHPAGGARQAARESNVSACRGRIKKPVNQRTRCGIEKRRPAIFYEFEIARAKHAELDAKYKQSQECEGVTVQVPNILDRALWAIRAILVHRTARAPMTDTAHPGRVAVAHAATGLMQPPK